jgi:outer membrane protein, heavy metal efflux system
VKRSIAVGLLATLCPLTNARAEAGGTAPPLDAARPAEEPVRIEDVLRLLDEQSPRLRAVRAQIPVAGSELIAAGAYPNPTLSYDLTDGLRGRDYVNGTQHQIELLQPVLIAGQRGARQEAARLGLRAAREQARSDRAALFREARTAFIELLAAQRRVTLLERARADLEHARSIVQGRAASGAMSQYDGQRIDLEAGALAARLDAARSERADDAGRLAVVLGLPEFVPRAVGDLGPSKLPQGPAAPRAVPELAAAEAGEKSALARLEVARRERIPSPVVGAGALFTTDGFTLSAVLGLSMDLPLFDRGQGAVARADAEVFRAARTREAVLAETRGERRRAEQTLVLRRGTLRAFQEQAVARLPRLQQMAEDAYQNGRGTVLDLLDTLRSVAETRLFELELEKAAALAEVDVRAARGELDVRAR